MKARPRGRVDGMQRQARPSLHVNNSTSASGAVLYQYPSARYYFGNFVISRFISDIIVTGFSTILRWRSYCLVSPLTDILKAQHIGEQYPSDAELLLIGKQQEQAFNTSKPKLSGSSFSVLRRRTQKTGAANPQCSIRNRRSSPWLLRSGTPRSLIRIQATQKVAAKNTRQARPSMKLAKNQLQSSLSPAT